MNNHPTDYGPELSVTSLQAEIFRLEGEIERLRRALAEMKERCAQVAENFDYRYASKIIDVCKGIAAAIREIQATE